MQYAVTHRTTYRYADLVHQSYHVLHLSPREVPHQRILQHRLTIRPQANRRGHGTDYFGNPFHVVNLAAGHRELIVEAKSLIDVQPTAAPDVSNTIAWEELAAGRSGHDTRVEKDVGQYSASSRHGRRIEAAAAFARPSFAPGRPVLAAAEDLMRRIFEEFTFDATATDVSTPVETVLETRRGVCQDFAHLQISAMRSLNLPVRYVSGYILTHPPEGQKRLQGADASHAWVSVWAPETGWVDFDPTNNMIPSDEHITFAVGRDYDDVSPISGVLLGGGSHTVDVAVDVVPETEMR